MDITHDASHAPFYMRNYAHYQIYETETKSRERKLPIVSTVV